MIPLRDTVPSERTPVVTWLLIAVCAGVYGYQTLLDFHRIGYRDVQMGRRVRRIPQTEDDQFVARWGATPQVVLRGYVTVEAVDESYFFPRRYEVTQPVPLRRRLATLVTSLFLHGSLMHLISNMLFLFIFGDNVEDRLGHFGFLIFYLAGGVIASISHILFNPLSSMPIIGASGAISAVLGAYFLLFPRAFVVTFVPIFFLPLMIDVPAILFLGLWFFSQITNGFGSLVNTTGGIAWFAHIGGFLFGVILTFLNYPQWRKPRPRHSEAQPFSV